MAVIPTRQCDACKKVEGKNLTVVHLDMKRSDGLRTIGDLCHPCLARMEKDYGLASTEKKRRKSFTIVD